MRPEVNFIQHKFDEFRNNIFSVKLPDIPIEISSSQRRLGCLLIRNDVRRDTPEMRYKMIFSDRYDLPQNMLEDIIIHEMIHLAIDVCEIADTSPHGKEFKLIMNKINKYFCRHITISTKLNDYIIATDNSDSAYYLISFTDNRRGRDYFMRCAKTFIPKAYTKLMEADYITDINIYVSFHPKFSQFPNSRSMRCFYMNSEISKLLSEESYPLKLE